SSVGEENLYALLHEPIFEPAVLKKREALLRFLDENPDTRLKLQMDFAKLGKMNYNGLSSFIFEPETKALANAWVYKILAFIPALCVGLMFFYLSAGIVLFVLAAMINGFVYYRGKSLMEKELNAMRYIAKVLYCAKNVLSVKSGGFDAFTRDVARHYVKFKATGGKISGISSAIGQKASELDFILDYVKLLFMWDLLVYNSVIGKIKRYAADFRALYQTLGGLDAAISILSYRKSLADGYVIPNFTAEKEIVLSGVYHPLVSAPVKNSAAVEKNILLTGSNASGKSTFTKAVAINILFAQTIYTCTADAVSFAPSFPVTSMAVRDDVAAGESYFIAEIKSLKRLMDLLNEDIRCVFMIDEILKGTNTVERVAASAAIIRFLSEKNCVCIVATHDIELTKLLADVCDNFHFSEHVTADGVVFDYTLKKGASKTRNAIRLLSFMGFDAGIVQEAERLATIQLRGVY
ncbi:MAG: hypothetical protein LBU77_06175, partial [Clostridiales bacterium]|nr:hypothetical protein [Clostridiales bacterium]